MNEINYNKLDKKQIMLYDIKRTIDYYIREYDNYKTLILRSFHDINNYGLYFYDGCKSIAGFILKNQYHTRSNKSIDILNKDIRGYKYGVMSKLSANEIDRIGTYKLCMISAAGVFTKPEILEYGQCTIDELKRKFGHKEQIKVSKDFKRKPNTKLHKIVIEVPIRHIKSLEADLIQLLQKYECRTP